MARAVRRADLTPAVTVDRPEPEAEAVAGDKFDVMTWPEAEAVAKVDPLLKDLLFPDAEAKTDVTEVQWRSEVSARLARLQAGLEALRTEDQKQRQVPKFAWGLAWFLLAGSIGVVIFGIHMGLAAPAQYAAASKTQARIASLNNQIASINKQAERVPHTKADLAAVAKCKRLTGDRAVSDCIVKADPTFAKNLKTFFNKNLQTSINDQLEVQGDNYQVQGDYAHAHELELEGPAVLAFGSALLGAALGWMLPQWFAGFSRE
jgi:hypothetical protein